MVRLGRTRQRGCSRRHRVQRVRHLHARNAEEAARFDGGSAAAAFRHRSRNIGGNHVPVVAGRGLHHGVMRAGRRRHAQLAQYMEARISQSKRSLPGLSSFLASGGFEERAVEPEPRRYPGAELAYQTYNELSAVCSLVQAGQGQRSLFKTDQNLFIKDDLLAGGKPRKFGRRRRKFGNVIEDNESRPAQSPGQDFALLTWAGRGRRPASIGGRAELTAAAVQTHGSNGRVGDDAAGIVEEDIVSLRACALDRKRDVTFPAIVDHFLVSVACTRQYGLFRRAREPYRTTSRESRQLADETSDAAGRGRYQNMIAGPWIAEAVERKVCGQTVDTQQAQICTERQRRGIHTP